jgi:hypothetical protein
MDKRTLAATVSLVTLLSTSATAGCPAFLQGSKVLTDRPCRESVNALLTAIKAERSSAERSNDVYALFVVLDNTIRSGDPVGDDVIDDLIALVHDRDESVRVDASWALGAIGPRARRGIPAMEAALAQAEEDERSHPQIFSTGIPASGAIRYALARVEGRSERAR